MKTPCFREMRFSLSWRVDIAVEPFRMFLPMDETLRLERKIIALIGAVQFVNILDFMMVMPMGPDFAKALGIPTSQLGLIGGSYTAAGAVAGLVCAAFLDRFDRKKALFFCMLGLVCGTFAGGFATGLPTLLMARVIAGLFGGPATSLSLSIIADVVPPARRGKAMGAVMGAFSAASVFGIPAGLELARLGGWRMPFFAVGGLALLVSMSAIWFMPAMTGHLARAKEPKSKLAPLNFFRPDVLLALGAIATSMLGSFLLVPNFSAFFQNNLHYPRAKMGLLYFVGGSASFVAMRIAGRWVDRFSTFAVVAPVTVITVAVLFAGFYHYPPLLPSLMIFAFYMVSTSVRGVCVSALSSRVPRPEERARFMSIQSAVQHFSCALGAFLSTQFLVEDSSGLLQGMPRLVVWAMGFAAVIPLIILALENQIRMKEGLLMSPARVII